MNKRTITLLSVCFVLAVTTLTIRYIEQEKESIKARFIGQTPAEEKSTGRIPSSRDVLPQTPPVEEIIPPVKQATNQLPLSGGMTPPSAGIVPPVTQSSPDGFASTGGKQVSIPLSGGNEKSVVRGKNALLDTPVSTTLEGVSTPLGTEEQVVVPAPLSEPQGGGGFDAQEAKAAGVEEKNIPEAETEKAGDAVKPVLAEEQTGQATAEGGVGEKDSAEEGAVTEDNSDQQGEEVIGEGETSEGEEVVEEDQQPAEGEVQQEDEGASGRNEEVPDEE